MVPSKRRRNAVAFLRLVASARLFLADLWRCDVREVFWLQTNGCRPRVRETWRSKSAVVSFVSLLGLWSNEAAASVVSRQSSSFLRLGTTLVSKAKDRQSPKHHTSSFFCCFADLLGFFYIFFSFSLSLSFLSFLFFPFLFFRSFFFFSPFCLHFMQSISLSWVCLFWSGQFQVRLGSSTLAKQTRKQTSETDPSFFVDQS